jgi:hypothetical protein
VAKLLLARSNESQELIAWLDAQANGLELSGETRYRLAAGCLDAAMEHQRAIVCLIVHSLYGSAFSLVRLLLEAYVRGAWLHQCATDVDLENFQTGKFDRNFGSLVADIEKLEGFDNGILSAVKSSSWSTMCSFTHTGFHQVVRRNSESFIEANYEEAELIEVLDFADGIGVMVVVEIAHLAGRHELFEGLLEKAKLVSARRLSFDATTGGGSERP